MFSVSVLIFLLFSTLLFPQNEFAREDLLTPYLGTISFTEAHSGLELVDAIYVINLDERPEKWRKVQEIFLPRGFNINRVSAINGRKMPLQIQKKLKSYSSNRLSEGQIGCFLSHLSVIKDAYERGFNIIWVLEDDVEFLEDPHQLSSLLSKLSRNDPEWDIFYTDLDTLCLFLGANFPLPSGKKSFPPNYYKRRILIDQDLMKINARYGAYSYFLSRNGMKKILDNLVQRSSLWSPFDHEIHFIPGLKQYSSTREIVTVADVRNSDTRPLGLQTIDRNCPKSRMELINGKTKRIKHKNNLIFCFIFLMGFLAISSVKKRIL